MKPRLLVALILSAGGLSSANAQVVYVWPYPVDGCTVPCDICTSDCNDQCSQCSQCSQCDQCNQNQQVPPGYKPVYEMDAAGNKIKHYVPENRTTVVEPTKLVQIPYKGKPLILTEPLSVKPTVESLVLVAAASAVSNTEHLRLQKASIEKGEMNVYFEQDNGPTGRFTVQIVGNTLELTTWIIPQDASNQDASRDAAMRVFNDVRKRLADELKVSE